MFHTQSLSAFS